MSVSWRVTNGDADKNINQTYTCRGLYYDDYCPIQHKFDSAEMKVEVIPARPLKDPQDGLVDYIMLIFSARFRVVKTSI